LAIGIAADDVAKRFNSSPSTTGGGNVWGGVYWKPLSEAYLKQRPERASGKLLIDTGELRKSFVPGDQNNGSRVEGKTAIIESKLPKARGLQKDRPIVFIHPDLVEEISTQWEKKLKKDLTKRVGRPALKKLLPGNTGNLASFS
jgi:hypothetical protein